MADKKVQAEAAFDDFIRLFEDKYPKAVACLAKDRNALMTFYDFPAAHWRHIRTTNPIESTFATVRLRTMKTKGCGTAKATEMMVFKLVQLAEKRWQRIHCSKLIPLVLAGAHFIDGELSKAA